jgi:hypothetical protein
MKLLLQTSEVGVNIIRGRHMESVANKNIHVEDQLLLPKDCLIMDTNALNKDEIIKTFYRIEICKQEACGIR